MLTVNKSRYYRIYSLLHGENIPFEDLRERRIITNKFLAERNKADISELTDREAEMLEIWLEAVC